jgi:hypothetical protein
MTNPDAFMKTITLTVMSLAMITASVKADVLINKPIDTMREVLKSCFVGEKHYSVRADDQQIDGSSVLRFHAVDYSNGGDRLDIEVGFVLRQVTEGTITVSAFTEVWGLMHMPATPSSDMEALALQLASR